MAPRRVRSSDGSDTMAQNPASAAMPRMRSSNSLCQVRATTCGAEGLEGWRVPAGGAAAGSRSAAVDLKPGDRAGEEGSGSG